MAGQRVVAAAIAGHGDIVGADHGMGMVADDRILAPATIGEVVPAAAHEDVVAALAQQRIVAVEAGRHAAVAEDQVVVAAADGGVVATGTDVEVVPALVVRADVEQEIVAVAAVQRVGTLTAQETVLARAAEQTVGALVAMDRIVAGEAEAVVGGVAEEAVILRPAVDQVGRVAALDRVGSALAIDRVGAGAAVPAERIVAGPKIEDRHCRRPRADCRCIMHRTWELFAFAAPRVNRTSVAICAARRVFRCTRTGRGEADHAGASRSRSGPGRSAATGMARQTPIVSGRHDFPRPRLPSSGRRDQASGRRAVTTKKGRRRRPGGRRDARRTDPPSGGRR